MQCHRCPLAASVFSHRESQLLPSLPPQHQIRVYSHIRTSPTQCPWNTKPYSSPKPKTMASCPFSHLLYFSESCISTCDLIIYLVKSSGVAPHTSSQSESQSYDAPAFTFPSVSTQPYSGPRCSSPGKPQWFPKTPLSSPHLRVDPHSYVIPLLLEAFL